LSDWSVWRALEEWRSRKHELDPLFATAGVAPELESMVTRVLVDLRRAPPTAPLSSGNKLHDEEEFKRFFDAFERHYDDSLFKAESLLRHPWVPEAEPIAQAVRAEVSKIRQLLAKQPGKQPDFSQLETLLQHYIKLNHPAATVSEQTLESRRRTLTDIAGFPLLVQHVQGQPFNDAVPPLASAAFQQEFNDRIQSYLQTPWLHCRLVSQWFITVAIDMALARKKKDAVDDAYIRESLSFRWPAPSVWFSDFEQGDQIWYLFLIIIAIAALFLEWWWVAFGLILWLNLSLGAFRRERKQIEARRAQIIARIQTMKKVRDRFAAGHTTLEKLETQLQQLDERGEFFDESILSVLHLHQHLA